MWLDQSLCPRHRSLCGFVAWNVQQAAASALTLTTLCRDCCRGADYLVRRSSGAVFLLDFTSRHVESPVHGVKCVVLIALSYQSSWAIALFSAVCLARSQTKGHLMAQGLYIFTRWYTLQTIPRPLAELVNKPKPQKWLTVVVLNTGTK